jgi:hypothetical protein
MLESRLADVRGSHVNFIDPGWQGHPILIHCRMSDGPGASGQEFLGRRLSLRLGFRVQQATKFFTGVFRVWHRSSMD